MASKLTSTTEWPHFCPFIGRKESIEEPS
uniref:Uncharacterized protein n=1 Tax=Rhizophora mucronata TaxID=61149 RepID=A0A2P2PW06_RHIMU